MLIVVTVATLVAAVAFMRSGTPAQQTETPLEVTLSTHQSPAHDHQEETRDAVSADVKRAIENRAIAGAAVYRRMLQKFSSVGLVISPNLLGGTSQLTLDLALPQTAWRSLSVEEKVALTYFVESQIAVVQRHPAIYSLEPIGAPIWPRIEAQARATCATCWMIFVGRYSSTGVSADQVVVRGDEVQVGAAGALDRATRFREDATGGRLQPLTWYVKELDPTARHAIPLSEDRFGHYDNDVFVYETPADRAAAWR
jgi:hypothetical protein